MALYEAHVNHMTSPQATSHPRKSEKHVKIMFSTKFSKKNRNKFFPGDTVAGTPEKRGDVKRWMSADEVGNTTADHVPSPFDLRVLNHR